MVRNFLDEWCTVRRSEIPHLSSTRFRSATLATASLFAPTLHTAAAELAADAGIPVDVVAVENQLLGESITVAGLLPAADVIAALRARDNLGDIVVLPRIMFDHPDGIALDDVSPMQVAQAIGRPVALADWMGDVVDALTGNNKLLFDPTTDVLHAPVVREGGWAVEKYL
jgi:NifB/MoaA-like Fe-S oxidoreductase